jgi:hypothetical protein
LLFDIAKEKNLAIHLNADRGPLLRLLRKDIQDETGQVRFIYEQDKREYYMDDCIIGRIHLLPDQPKLKGISVSLNKWECYRMISEVGNIREHYEEIDFIDLGSQLNQDIQESFVTFKLPLGQYNIQPTLKFISGSICFYSGYFLKLEVTEMNEKKWTKCLSFSLHRGK